jgi:hypothetical protein
MLDGKTLNALFGKLAGAQFGEEARAHQLLHAWVDNFLEDRFDKWVGHKFPPLKIL